MLLCDSLFRLNDFGCKRRSIDSISGMSTARPLKVAFFHPDLGIGGAERLIVDAAAALVAKVRVTPAWMPTGEDVELVMLAAPYARRIRFCRGTRSRSTRHIMKQHVVLQRRAVGCLKSRCMEIGCRDKFWEASTSCGRSSALCGWLQSWR